MPERFTEETATAVLGGIEFRVFPDGQRRQLNIDDDLVIAPTDNIAKFNAVGSRTNWDARTHLPILDICGTVELQDHRVSGSKAVLHSFFRDPSGRPPTSTYTPQSLLVDVLGDYGIETEIDRSSSFMIALRSEKKGAFEAFRSPEDNHSHLYIQREFSAADHQTLLSELRWLGIVKDEWYKLTEEAGMGIVRAPWSGGEPINGGELSPELGE